MYQHVLVSLKVHEHTGNNWNCTLWINITLYNNLSVCVCVCVCVCDFT